MKRLEKRLKEKNSKKKYKSICRVVFILVMIIITTNSILLIDYRINKILDDDSKNNLVKYINIF